MQIRNSGQLEQLFTLSQKHDLTNVYAYVVQWPVARPRGQGAKKMASKNDRQAEAERQRALARAYLEKHACGPSQQEKARSQGKGRYGAATSAATDNTLEHYRARRAKGALTESTAWIEVRYPGAEKNETGEVPESFWYNTLTCESRWELPTNISLLPAETR